MRVCALSCITNHAAGIAPAPLRHEDVVAAGARVAADFTRLLASAVPELAGALTRDRRGA
jgi:purine nucleoside phosphorylase